MTMKEYPVMTNQFGDLRMQALKMFSDAEEPPYQGTFSDVRDLLDKVRESLSPPGQQLGMWETAELNAAEQALDAGFPKLALIDAGKAMAVHRLSEAEYAFGFDSARRQKNTSAETTKAHTDSGAFQTQAAQELLTGQKEAAHMLAQVEEEAARKLESVEEATATTLAGSQRDAAMALLKEDGFAASELVRAQAAGLEGLKVSDTARTAQLHEQEQALSWMAGGYSMEYHMPGLSSEDAYTAMNDTQKTAALTLKERQAETAADLKKDQTETASGLKESERLDASTLKTEQQQAALRLREAQTVKAMQKKGPDKTTNDDQEQLS
jgi:hypothetical protein